MNKQHAIYTLLLLLSVLCSCNGGKYPQYLLEADSLCMANPDSALTLLKSKEKAVSAEPEASRMYYRLLTVKASDKAYRDLVQFKDVEEIVDYYEDAGDKNLLSQAYYYAASVFRDLRYDEKALNYYEKALDGVEAVPDNYRFISNTYCQKGYLLQRQHNYDKAIEEFMQSCRYDSLNHDYAGEAYNLRNIAYCYDLKKDFKRSEHHYLKALSLAEAHNDSVVAYRVLVQLSSLYYGIRQFDKAYETLKPCLESTGFYRGKSAAWGVGINIYLARGEYGKARRCCYAIINDKDINKQRSAAKALSILYMTAGERDSVVKYTELYGQYCDSTERTGVAETMAKMAVLYDYNKYKEENVALKLSKKNMIAVFLCSISLLLLLTCAILGKNIHYKNLRLSYMKRIKDLDAMLKELQTDTDKAIHDQSVTIHDQSVTIEDLKNELQQKEQAILELKEKDKGLSAQVDELKKTFAESISYTKIQNRTALSPKDFEKMEEMVKKHFPDFRHKLNSCYRLNDVEYKVCLLIKLGLSVDTVSSVVNMSANGIYKIKSRLYKKMFGVDGTSRNFDNFIKSL